MNKYKKIALIMVIALFISCLFVGCGIPPEQLEQIKSQLAASQAKVAELQSEKSQADIELAASQAQVTRLQEEVGRLQGEYAIIGATPEETARNIVKRYHETHIYSKYDFFVCSNMSLDVWNMLKAQGVKAQLMIGDVKTGVGDIAGATHAWVLAEVPPGQYLALETTGGYAVPENENSLYYKGWAFDNPKEYNIYEELRREWNIRVDIISEMNSKMEAAKQAYQKEHDVYEDLINEFNQKYAGKPVSAESESHQEKIEAQLAIVEEKEGRCNQLEELIDGYQAKMESIRAEMSNLTTKR